MLWDVLDEAVDIDVLISHLTRWSMDQVRYTFSSLKTEDRARAVPLVTLLVHKRCWPQTLVREHVGVYERIAQVALKEQKRKTPPTITTPQKTKPS